MTTRTKYAINLSNQTQKNGSTGSHYRELTILFWICRAMDCKSARSAQQFRNIMPRRWSHSNKYYFISPGIDQNIQHKKEQILTYVVYSYTRQLYIKRITIASEVNSSNRSSKLKHSSIVDTIGPLINQTDPQYISSSLCDTSLLCYNIIICNALIRRKSNDQYIRWNPSLIPIFKNKIISFTLNSTLRSEAALRQRPVPPHMKVRHSVAPIFRLQFIWHAYMLLTWPLDWSLATPVAPQWQHRSAATGCVELLIARFNCCHCTL
jgi:hypothetical protein